MLKLFSQCGFSDNLTKRHARVCNILRKGKICPSLGRPKTKNSQILTALPLTYLAGALPWTPLELRSQTPVIGSRSPCKLSTTMVQATTVPVRVTTTAVARRRLRRSQSVLLLFARREIRCTNRMDKHKRRRTLMPDRIALLLSAICETLV